jgi:hypothetical protein
MSRSLLSCVERAMDVPGSLFLLAMGLMTAGAFAGLGA